MRFLCRRASPWGRSHTKTPHSEGIQERFMNPGRTKESAELPRHRSPAIRNKGCFTFPAPFCHS
jgi:hypothetical protein